jgi:hypothetical protein
MLFAVCVETLGQKNRNVLQQKLYYYRVLFHVKAVFYTTSLNEDSFLKIKWISRVYEGVSKSFRTESITKYTLTTLNTR